MDLIQKIVDRLIRESVVFRDSDRLGLEMDLVSCHFNAIPLRLDEMLNTADKFSLFHDVVGIHSNLDRNTGKLNGHFLPRFTVLEGA
jgi:hypothetical protein